MSAGRVPFCASRAAVARAEVVLQQVQVGAVVPREGIIQQTPRPGQVKPVLVTYRDGRKLKQPWAPPEGVKRGHVSGEV